MPNMQLQSTIKYRRLLFVALALIVMLGGIRFSDGSVLLAISQGATIEHRVFLNASTQYVWGSPLKVYILWALPASIFVIAAVFALIGVLPSLYFLKRDPKILFISVSVLLLTPAFKISMQNLGVGDGAVIALVILACTTKSRSVIFGCLLLVGLWHPQQAFFIGLSWVLGQLLYTDRVQKPFIIFGMLGLFAAALWFFYYNALLGFEYADRADYMVNRFRDLVITNLRWTTVAILPTALWFAWIAPSPKCMWALLSWLSILVIVSLLTTDITRVFTLASLPLVAFGASKLYEAGEANQRKIKLSNKKIAVMFLAILLIPPYSWSGLDIFLWSDLASDLCKWGVSCAR